MRPALTPFAYEALPVRVRFGAGTVANLAEVIDRLRLRRVAVLCSPGRAGWGDTIGATLGGRFAGLVPEARMHLPDELTERAVTTLSRLAADGCVALGGGSAIGLGKLVTLELGLPVVAVPTTYAGSAMTTVWGRTRDGRKTTGRHPRVLPASVLYDPELTLDLPVPTSVTSGLNAIAHAAEALYAPDVTPITSLLAAEGVRALVAALPAIVQDQRDLGARTLALYGAWLCGTCLGATTMSLHHKLCHVLGGTLDLPHAETHAVVLPHVLALNLAAAPAARNALAELLGSPDPALRLWDLAEEWGAPRSLAALGMGAGDARTIADEVVAHPYANPVPVDRDDVEQLLEAAWAGRPPQPCTSSAMTRRG